MIPLICKRSAPNLFSDLFFKQKKTKKFPPNTTTVIQWLMTYTGGKSKSNLFGSTAQNNVVINPKSCQRKPLQPGKMFVFCFLHSQNAHISQAGGQSTTILHHLKSIKVTGNNLKRSKMEDDGTR